MEMELTLAIRPNPDPPAQTPSNPNTHTLLTFTCYHFAIIPNTSHLAATNLLRSISLTPSQSVLNLTTKPTTTLIPLPTSCPSPQCLLSPSSSSASSSSSSSSPAFPLSERALTQISQTSTALQIQLSTYFRSAQTYHSLPFSLRASLADIPECRLAHEQFGGIETLRWDVDPFFEPYVLAAGCLGEAAGMVEGDCAENGGEMTRGVDGRVRGKVDEARVQIGRLVRGMEVLKGYFEERYGGEDEDEGLRVLAVKQGIRRGWLMRLGEIEGVV